MESMVIVPSMIWLTMLLWSLAASVKQGSLI
jgi:hypothetical protein